MWKWLNSTWVTVLEILKVNEKKGIREEEVSFRKEEWGENIITLKTKESLRRSIFRTLKNPFIIILFIITGLAIYSLDLYGVIPFFFLIFSIKILTQMQRAEYKVYESLQELNESSCRVMRDGISKTIDVKEVVVGDIVEVRDGNIIPADLRVIEDDNLKVNESIITGEDTIVEKNKTFIFDRNIGITEMKNILFKGTKVVRGEGVGVVVQVGDRTEIGRILNCLGNNEMDDEYNIVKHLMKWMNKWSVIILVIACLLGGVTAVINKSAIEGVKGTYKSLTFIYPFFIGVMYLFTKGMFKKDLVKNGIYIRDINVLKKLNRVDRLLLNKTGTLTEEVEVLKNIYTHGEELNIKDRGVFRQHNGNRIINIAYFASEKDNLIDNCIDEYIEKLNLDDEILNNGRFLFKIPYDSEKRLITYVNEIEDFYRAHIKGNVDGILERSTHIMKNGVEIEMNSDDIRSIREKDIEYSSKGYEVIALAYRNFSYEPSAKENIESHLVFVGLMSFLNPIREKAKEYVNNCYENCIIPIIFTEDNKLSALTLSEKIGINAKLPNIITGVEIDYTLREEFERNIKRFYVFSKTDHYQRLNIISMLQQEGYNVLVTGNKVKDIPLMTTAHVGIGVGEDISPLVKKLSDIYIKNNYLDGIFHSIRYSKGLMNGFNKAKDSINKVIIVTSLFAPIYLFATEDISKIFLISFNIVTLPIIILSLLNSYVKESFWVKWAGYIYMFINAIVIAIDFYLKKNILNCAINALLVLTIALIYFNIKKQKE